ncbi:SDR family NAD(P)-dependent oxidoreductase [Actinopolyspora sp. H202]|uniref:SDR family NAD(P)-dependent oxidoreductase n=1 Tax=Actinopolyspora sp. H202 TaxID=1500456 RepID=UPI003EE4D223
MHQSAIAVVGVSCRFPGADDHHRFWGNLATGRSHTGEVTGDRWEKRMSQFSDTFDEYAAGTFTGTWAGLIDDVDAFDASFFRLSPLEAESVDPQQRIMLELTWSCLEDAAIQPSALSGTDVGVFFGSFGLDYKELQEQQLCEVPAHHSTGTAGAVIANRVSHFFDFRGPSVVVDTASSASLHALHLAVQSLQQGECGLALAGGINLVLTPARHVSFSKTGMLSPTGSCRPFDERADGYVRGEGAGVVVLKPIADAIRDGDSVYGVITGSAVNHSGRTRTLTYPSPQAQAKVVSDAIARAGISPDTIGYVEAHGTGTPTGDPVEFEGLVEGFRAARAVDADPWQYNVCGLGSVKPNIGHLEAAAGIAGVIKVLLAMKHKQLPGLPDFQDLNPRIDLTGTPFNIVDSLREWEPLHSERGEPLPRRAGVSSFGIGGTNAHVVIEEAPPAVAAVPESRVAYLVCLSAKTAKALQRRIRDLREWLTDEEAGVSLADLSATLLLGREHFDCRTALVVRDRDELVAQLTALLETGEAEGRFQAPVADRERDETARCEHENDFDTAMDLPAAEHRQWLVELARTFVEGDEPSWTELFESVGTRRLRLPTYAFERRRFWFTPNVTDELPGSAEIEHPTLAVEHEEPVSETTVDPRHRDLIGAGVQRSLEADLRSLAGDVLKLDADEIPPTDRLSDLGFDSVGNTRLAGRLSEYFGIDVTPSLFYEHFTLEMLRDYLLQEHTGAVVRVYAVADEADAADTAVPVSSPVSEVPAESTAVTESVATTETTAVVETTVGPRPSVSEGADDGSNPIAVIGMSGRFPQARTVDDFWQLLVEGRDAVEPIPEHRLRGWRTAGDGIRGGWVPGVAEFDPLFFEIPPKEAESMDPRQRLLLQEAWQALEDAGYGAKHLRDSTIGMFVGAEQGDYQCLAEDAATLTSGHDGILAARLAYFLNFSGPVLTINTACSAGLAAVHQACLSLRSGECDTAVAAGVNVLAGSQFYEHSTRAGMLSADGTCYAFDKRANGMVMAEAVAAVVLKPLEAALADGDRVHALIKASGINHDGRTNGITAPSQSAQTALLDSVYGRFGVDPADIEHVVAHGTGTRLGDPIEVNALAEAFGRHTDKNQYCALTSVKTNIGHTLAASGVVSLIALVQGLRHRIMPASLHCEQDSEYIDWQHSPFYVNKETRPWPEVPGRNRSGAVSSFGISGTNAHVVVEGFDAGSPAYPVASRPSYLLALSAKTDEALRERVADLLAFLRAGEAEEVDLGRVSSTLLSGRHHFAYRCALVAATVEEAELLLQRILDGKKVPQVFRGGPSRDFRPQTALTEYGNELIGRTRATGDETRYQDAVLALADLYCQGYELNWESLFGDRPLPCVSLPGYPFAREEYWTGADRSGPEPAPSPATAALHPLLDRNDSTFQSLRFSKHLSTDEFFLRDHVVDGKILLPGVAHLEMAYTAARMSTGSDTVTLRDIIWGHPVVLADDGSRTISIELSLLEQDSLEYVIHDELDGQRTVFSQGRAICTPDQPTRVPGGIDIPAIKARCTGRRENPEIFVNFREVGFGYGPTFQAIETLYCGETEALARLVLDESLEDDYSRFTLHPSLFDAAVNTLRGIGYQDGVLRIPFSLEELMVFAPIPRRSYCHGTIHRIGRDGEISVDLAICDDDGTECVRLTGLVFKEVAPGKSEQLLYYVPRWSETDVALAEDVKPLDAGRVLLVLDEDDARSERLRADYSGSVVRVRSAARFEEIAPDLFGVDRRDPDDFDRLLEVLDERVGLPHAIVNLWSLTSDDPDLTIELESALHLFRAVHRTGAAILHLSVLSDEPGPHRAAGEALAGFARAIPQVNHLFRMNSLHVAGAGDTGTVVDSVLQELCVAEGDMRAGREIRRADGVRSERLLRPWSPEARHVGSELPLKEGGVYLISGGVGALGTILGTYLARQCRARLVLLGRRASDDTVREKIAALEEAGAEVLYLTCDVADSGQVSAALAAARERFGTLDGVFHGAGLISGTPVLDVDRAGLAAVLAPKLRGTVHLDELTVVDSLDFFVAFSSIAAYVGDFGQGSYAAANRFLDGYVQHREGLREEGLRHGRSLSINWPYWDDGGMLGELAEDGAAKALYYDYSGLRGLRTEEGIEALLRILASGETQVMVTKGERPKIEKVLRVAGGEHAQVAAKPEQISTGEPVAVANALPSVSTSGADDLFDRTVDYLKDRLSQVFGIPQSRIDTAAELGDYGIESVQIMELMRTLGKDFEAIPGTLFFEYRTIQELAGYFTEHQAARLAELLDLRPTAAAESPQSTTTVPADDRPAARGGFTASRTHAASAMTKPSAARADHGTADRSRDVAIIGISGRYPRAWNLNELWKVLERGEDCIEEIPPHRWDKDAYYAPEKAPGKTDSKWGGFIDGAENFDALFFNMSPNQAAVTDPQTRLFLQATWEAMEDAGYTRQTLTPGKSRDVSVYLGMMWNEYQLLSGRDVVLSDRAAAANAVSYFFNLHGQSLTVDTACSSSLYAIAMAVENIRSGSSSLAFAGGANLSLHPNKYVSLSQMNFFAKDGRCRSFGDGGTGYVPGEGVGCVLLKSLDSAIEDGDHIYGVIRGVATMHGGKTNGMTVPNPLAQADMVTAALEDAGISAEDVSYVEGHGTGTSLGDPIEITGLTRAFREHTGKKQFCPIGSVKSNIGHLEGAAGVVAVTKVLLQMREGTLVPSLHSEQLNPYIDFPNSPFYVQQKLEPWERRVRTTDGGAQTLPRIAGVSSFGAHGAIAHVIIEEYLPERDRPEQPDRDPRPQLIVLSAKDSERLREQAEALLAWLAESGRDADLVDVAYTLQVGREAMEERLALVVDGHDALRQKLRAFLDDQSAADNVVRGNVRQHAETVALLEADAQMGEVVQGWLREARYEKLAEVWVKGLALDWASVARDTVPRRISLPTYPFAQERHWLETPPAGAIAQPDPVAVPAGPASQPAAEERARPLAFVEDWEPAELDSVPMGEVRSVVFLCTGAGRQDEVARAVRALDPTVRALFVGYGETCRRLSSDSYQIRRGEAADIRETFRDIAAGQAGIDAIVSLEALESGAVSGDFSDVVLTIQAIAESGIDAARLVIAGQYHDGVERALIEANLGFERSVGLVMPNSSVVAVLQDGADPHRPADVATWIERLFAELHQDEPVSALYRDGQRFVTRVREAVPAEDRPSVLRHGGTYLITGGCGGLGLIVARHLTEHFAANLVLTGRSPLDESRREALRELGPRVSYSQADVADPHDMKRVLEQARQRWGAVHGVVHAAGVQSEDSILQKDLHSFDSVLAPKIRGTLALDEALVGEPLDFVCYFSSVAAVIGDFGSCDYAVGNRFQMAYARHRAAQVDSGRSFGRTVVINWPLWREGGMGFDDDTTTMLLRSSGQDFLETTDGLALFERLLSQRNTGYLIVVGKPSRVSQFLGQTPPDDTPARSITSTAAPRPAVSVDVGVLAGSAPDIEECLEKDLRQVVGRTVNLSPDRLHDDDNLADYGFDSVSLAELAAQLGKHFGVAITPALFFSHSTLAKLKRYFATEHADRLAALYGGSAAASEPAAAPEPNAVASEPSAEDSVRPQETSTDNGEAVAIIGMSGRFPGADDPDQLWSVLEEGRDVVSGVARERLDLWDEPHDSPFAAFRVGQLSGPDEFDPLFFEISPKEARTMDPRQRLLLQESWRALEDAGWTPEATHRIGMFAGVEQGDYEDLDPGAGTVTANHDGILAARLSYFLGLNGPVMAVNTACSSGLVAAHQAGASIRNGECEVALAAGVSLITTPRVLTHTQQAGMLSEDGVTYAFDKRANGMVLGEAVAVVALKRLSAAVADGDRIYGVIRGSGINYDGRSNGITAPNGEAQVELLRDTYRRYGIDPADIEYMVAHGTGTRLGDPVEVNALKDVFREATGKRQYCALTSVKPNVGHTLAASGLVSLIAVLQAMRHETIPTSLHYERENDYIDWKDGPFFVNTVNRPWPEVTGRTRTAALSSFGMSGTNAHMVVESHPVRDPDDSGAASAHLLAVSAKSEESLRQRVADLIDFLEDATHPHDLRAVGATLLGRRSHFPYRCAVVAADTAEAVDLLRRWARDESGPEIFTGHVPKSFVPLGEVRQAGDQLLEAASGLRHDAAAYRDALCGAAKTYCQGYDLSWRLLFGASRTVPVALPGYPFAKRRLWQQRTSRSAASVALQTVSGGSALRPVPTDSMAPRFGVTLTGTEYFLRDHVVAGEKVLPGVAHLELVRAAHEIANSESQRGASAAEFAAPSDGEQDQPAAVTIRDVVWRRPVKVGDGPLDLEVAFDGTAGYRVLESRADGREVVYSQGRIEAGAAPVTERLDLAGLRAECGLYEIAGEEAYLAYRRQGIAYGPSFQGLVRLFVGEAQVLAELALPDLPEPAPGSALLHPGLLDAALQASLGLGEGNEGLRLPYAVGAVEILGPCEPVMYAWLHRTERSGERFDVDFCDAQGEIRVRIRAFSTRPLRAAPEVEPMSERSVDDGRLTMLAPDWEEIRLPSGRAGEGNLSESWTLLVGDDPEVLADVLTDRENVDVLLLRPDETVDGLRARLARRSYGSIVWLAWSPTPVAPDSEELISRQERGVYACFRLAKALLALGYEKHPLEWTALTVGSQFVVDGDRIDPTHTGVHGLLGSLAKENVRWQVRLADVAELRDDVVEEALRLPVDSSGFSCAHRGGRWYRQTLTHVTLDNAGEEVPYQRNRVYVVIGGAGGLGAVWTEHVVRHYGAQVVWIGRRDEDEAIRAKIHELALLGPAPWYLQADATDGQALAAAVARIKTRFPQIHGVVHSALALLDQSVAGMSEERFRAAVRAKLDISVHMAREFAAEPLDFVLFFSSANSFQRSAGQSNYVCGCVFTDAFALLWQQTRSTSVKVVNWSYWGSVGVVATDGYHRRMAHSGIGSIEPAEGMAALDLLLSGPYHQLVVEKTTAAQRTVEVAEPAPDSVHGRQLQRVLDDSGSARGFDDALLCELLLVQLRTLGMSEEGVTADDLGAVLKPGDGYDRWLETSLRTLTEHGYLASGSERYIPTGHGRADTAAWQRWEEVCRQSGGTNPYVNLLDPVIRALPDILTGRRPATDVIFPDSSMALVRGLYRDCDSATALNEVVAELVTNRVGDLLGRDPDHRVRILEVGAGCGGTSEQVLRLLAPYRDNVVEYCYTDVSQYFLRNGRQEFGDDYRYIRFELFDVEQDPAAQGLRAGDYDIVVATNVLHATRDVRMAVRNVGALLAGDGALVLNELAAGTLFLHLTFGLLDGWWLYEDPELRIQGCPGLAPGTWRRVLEEQGFTAVSFPAEPVHDAGHQIVVAQAGEPARAPESVAAPAAESAGDPHEWVERVILAQVEKLLELDRREISEEDAFSDYGVDSILGVELIGQLNGRLGGVLVPTDLFDHGSVRRLAAYVAETFPEQARALADVGAPSGTSGPDVVQATAPPAAHETVVGVNAASQTSDTGFTAAVTTAATVAPQPDDSADGPEPIAIVGMSGRFGTAEDVDQLWQHLVDGRSLVGEISRWDLSAFVPPGASYPRYAALMDGIDRFDPAFFQISGLEAAYMDPQQRMVLEESWKALEDAGYAGEAIRGRPCGVYIGTQVSDYLTGSGQDTPAQAMWGNAEAIIPARVSYALDLQGPALAVDTACSGSLVALHTACQALRAGEVGMALAGGVSVQCTPGYYLDAHKAGMLSETGQCHTFDERADGFVPGEGVGVVVLKPLRDALSDGDHIHGVVRGSGINQDGTSNGITAPSAKAQERLEREVYDTFGIDPAGIDLVEAHGTGTRLGDPIEFQALTRAFRHHTDERGYCALGSIKTNIGHAAPASGMAGLIKVLLALRHRELPRSLHFEQGNTHIEFEGSPFYVNTEHRPWASEPGRPRLAALSSFGFSGTNAHVVLEQAPDRPRQAVSTAADHLVTLSAFSREQVRNQAQRLAEQLRRHPDTALGDISMTLLLGRRHCPVRLACVVGDTAELVTALDRWLVDGHAEHVRFADLTEITTSPQPASKQFGEHCLRQCAEGAAGAIRREHLEAVRDLYLQGYELEYARLFEAGTYRRVPLPVYPFQRQRHWLPEQGTPPRAEHLSTSSSSREAHHQALAPLWIREEAPGAGRIPDGDLVVMGGDAADRAALAAERPDAHFLADPGALGAETLVEQLRRVGTLRHVVWISPDSAAGGVQRINVGVLAFFRLIKALFASGHGGADLAWTVVTRQTQSVLGGEPVLPADAGVLGLAEVMAKELPNWNVKSFDLGVTDQLPVRTLLAAPAQSVRALHNGQWFRRGLSPVDLPEASRSPYREGGVYVVVGGAGGIGRLFSEHLIRNYGARIVWIGRRERNAVQTEIDRLAGLGHAPWYVQADAADPDSLLTAYAQIRQHFGVVHGVVHSAFGLVDQSLSNTTEQQFRQGLRAKIDAGIGMAEVFDTDELDFMLIFSSIASVSPSMGYCSYVAGNAFQDALALRLSGERRCAVKVVNWGYWGAVGSGLEVPEHVRERIYEQEGLGDIDPGRAMDAVERLLAAPLDQMVYLNTSKPERFDAYTDRESVRALGTPRRGSEPLVSLLPSRGESLQSVQTQAKSKLLTLDALLTRLLWCTLHGRGWIGDGVFDAESLRLANGIMDKYDRWLSETLRLFAREGWIMETGTGYRGPAAEPLDADAVSAEWERSKREWLADRELRASVELVDKTLPALTDILTGSTPAVDVIFPDSSLNLVDGIYKSNMIADYFNDVVGDCVVALIERALAQDPAAEVRVLEVGAGTGGTTATVLHRIQPYRQHVGEYCYTDVSKAFLTHGEREFGAEHPYLRCEVFDAGQPVAEQGFGEGGYDLVIATNVLHATEDIRTSLRNSKALLKPGGALLVNEINGYSVFGMLTFGLLDGWWLYADPEIRDTGGPGLQPDTWKSVLEWEGFEDVEFVARDAHALGQQVVVGCSDGLIRQVRDGRSGREAEAADEPDTAPQPTSPATQSAEPTHTRVDEAVFAAAVRAYLSDLIGRTLRIPVDSIDAREPLSTYGIDSILVMQLLNSLEKDLGECSSTLFFEYRTIEALTEYFVTERGETVARALGLAPAAAPAAPVVDEEAAVLTPSPPPPASEPASRGIAIIGMSGRFPQAETLDAFWENLCAGRNTATEIPADRWPLESFYEPDKEKAAAEGKSYSKWGSFLEGFADFDPLFFEMTPNEALQIDPQERLFLQETWRAFEDAGYPRARIEEQHHGRVGVFAGITRAGHNLYGPERWSRGDTTYPYTSFGSSANRVSFKLNLNGPSMPVDTMCSSSLTALHEACEHLLHGDSEMAVAGGVNLYLHPSSYINLCNLEMLADGDRCRSFGAAANGFVPGEGVGALVLKRLDDAERDGDHIHAVIRGTSINHGGTTNGYTVPNPVAQGRVIRSAFDRAGVDARTISYIEAHGTGTALGDPIEINGLNRAFSQDTQDVQFCAIGSVKSNIGHAEAAAGIAGVFKTLLQLRHGQLVPSLHAEEPNPNIHFGSTPFALQRELAPWQRPVVPMDGVVREVPRRAGVSSFGAGGANAHVMIEEYVHGQRTVSSAGPVVVVLSAKDEQRLTEQASNLLRWLSAGEREEVALADIAYTLQIGREAMTERLGTVVNSYAELTERLRTFLEPPGSGRGLHRGRAGRTDRGVSALIADEDMSAVTGKWLAEGKYAKVLDLWVNGFEVDWRRMYSGRSPRIVPLPTYPFARERYWIVEQPVGSGTGAPDGAAESAESPIDDILDNFLSGSLSIEAAAEHIRLSAENGNGRNTYDGGR